MTSNDSQNDRMTPEEVEKFLAVGAIATFNPHPSLPQEQRFRTAIRGWKRGEYIILDMPPRQHAGSVYFRDKQPCLIHFFYEGTACGFDAEVLEIPRSSAGAEFWVSWPGYIHSVAVRQHERLKISLPCTLNDDHGTTCAGEIQDLSEGGCLARANVAFNKGAIITLRLAFPDGAAVDPIRAEIRNMRGTPGGYFIGCAFREVTPTTKSSIAFYITSAYSLLRGKMTQGRRTLLIQGTSNQDVSLLDDAIMKFRVDMVVSSGALEGFHRLHVLRPMAVLLEADVPPDAVALGTVIKQTPGFENTLVFIYGGDAQTLAPRIAAAGLDGHVPLVTDAKRIDSRPFQMALAGFSPSPQKNP
ncbi:MAG TPA: PilZ domain-containing protein [Candidatus Hydrogenedentes bacterium]|mgnify:CR=1 FL=1|nr:PilZ domain-containing protein [Candidatus Hydrogenedentota bacterium]HOS02919.1 PilZ domain-containing protein [Candidatus Hydrogenedentota bacterium]